MDWCVVCVGRNGVLNRNHLGGENHQEVFLLRRLFGNSGACSACGQMIPASEFVMRAQGNVYHLKCFTCVKCHNQLVPGDRYNLMNGSVLCEQDCIKMLKGTVNPAGVRKTKMRVNSAIKV
ncbi:LIM domain transcription factor LMO4.2 [Caerostris extrusa]|uniref:LIM domain transcription factor LMO4.2 n=1 Tax=Caerostris extrusa TaxID=172846 RepID=A0AAV4VA75_CAEEX|nr:LIM domain transcription factor LMO4.2 [Caerostris extrusa]